MAAISRDQGSSGSTRRELCITSAELPVSKNRNVSANIAPTRSAVDEVPYRWGRYVGDGWQAPSSVPSGAKGLRHKGVAVTAQGCQIGWSLLSKPNVGPVMGCQVT